MEEKDLKISIANLYPQLLNLNGDMGNVKVLIKRCEWRGIKVEYDEIALGDSPKEHDLYFLGDGLEHSQEEVLSDMRKNKDFYVSERDKGSVFLGVCAGYQILCNSYMTINNEKFEALGLLNTYSENSDKRFSGHVTLEVDFLESNKIVGFENHTSNFYIKDETVPFGRVFVGNGNNGKDCKEGSRFKNVFGTSLHGPLLAINPCFADYLIELALEKRYGKKIKLSKLDDEFEDRAHNLLVGKVYR